jgi:hypothetical protein
MQARIGSDTASWRHRTGSAALRTLLAPRAGQECMALARRTWSTSSQSNIASGSLECFAASTASLTTKRKLACRKFSFRYVCFCQRALPACCFFLLPRPPRASCVCRVRPPLLDASRSKWKFIRWFALPGLRATKKSPASRRTDPAALRLVRRCERPFFPPEEPGRAGALAVLEERRCAGGVR